jgi:hypothetical protein
VHLVKGESVKALLVAGTLVALVAAEATASAHLSSRVRSSLDGKSALPYRIAWNAYPSAPSSRIKQVDFLVDGKVRWIEHHPPYSYADGDALVTTWLSPGSHRFTVRAIETGGARASDTVIARVLAAPDPPSELAGSWHRTVDTSSLHNPPGVENPSGTYTLTFDPRWIQARFPGRFIPGDGAHASVHDGHGWIIDAYATYNSSTITLPGAVNFQVLTDWMQEGGFWCGPRNPAAYRWAVNGDTLTLSPAGRDRCAGRKFIWSGDWTRG